MIDDYIVDDNDDGDGDHELFWWEYCYLLHCCHDNDDVIDDYFVDDNDDGDGDHELLLMRILLTIKLLPW